MNTLTSSTLGNKKLLVLTMKYTPEYVYKIKLLPIEDREWNPTTKEWLLADTAEVYQFVTQTIFPLRVSIDVKLKYTDTDKELCQFNKNTITKLAKDIKLPHTFKTKPYNHQLVALNFLQNKSSAALLMEMGTGKTKVIIDQLSYLMQTKKVNKVLVVAPNSCLDNWEYEIQLHSSIAVKTQILLGSAEKRNAYLLDDDITYFIINYEALRIITNSIMHSGIDAVVYDESSRIKSPKALMAKAAHIISGNVYYRFILSGTPLTQSYMDIFSQYKALDVSVFGGSYYAFRARYAVMGGFLKKQVIGYNNETELREKIFSIGIRIMKKDCLDLPDKIYEVRKFSLSPEQLKVYKELATNLITAYNQMIITAPMVLVKLTKLQQITSGFVNNKDIEADTTTTIELPNTKLNELESLLDDLLPDQIVIWCKFIHDIKIIAKLLTKLKVSYVEFYGEVSREDRTVALQDFESCRKNVFIGQVRTGGLGINLVSANKVIYYSNSYSLEDRLQSEDRSHRIGQKNNVTYIDLVAKGTIDEAVRKILLRKSNMTDLINKNNLENIIKGEI